MEIIGCFGCMLFPIIFCMFGTFCLLIASLVTGTPIAILFTSLLVFLGLKKK